MAGFRARVGLIIVIIVVVGSTFRFVRVIVVKGLD